MSAPTEETTTGENTDANIERLYREYHYRVVAWVKGRYAGVHDANDVTHDAVERILRKRDQLDRLDAEEGHSLLFKIAGDAAADDLRRASTLARAPLHLLSAPEPERPDEHAVRTVDRELVHKVLSALSEDDRRLMRLRYWSQMTCLELSEHFGLSGAAVRQRLSRAHQQCASMFARLSAVFVPMGVMLREGRRHLVTSSGSAYAALGVTSALTLAVGMGLVMGDDEADANGMIVSQTSTPGRFSPTSENGTTQGRAPQKSADRPVVTVPDLPRVVEKSRGGEKPPVAVEGNVYVDPDPEDPKESHDVEVDTPAGTIVIEGSREGTAPPTVCQATGACEAAGGLLPE